MTILHTRENNIALARAQISYSRSDIRIFAGVSAPSYEAVMSPVISAKRELSLAAFAIKPRAHLPAEINPSHVNVTFVAIYFINSLSDDRSQYRDGTRRS